MPVDIHNFLAQNSPRFNRVDMARRSMGNALMRNQVDRLPQENRAHDLDIEAAEQDLAVSREGLSAAQKKTAAGLLAYRFKAVADATDPLRAGASFIGGPDFQAAGKILGLPVDQFSIGPTDNPDEVRARAREWMTAMGGVASRLENTDIPSNVRVAEYYAGLPDSGTGVTRSVFNEANRAPTIRDIGGIPTQVGPGATTTPLSTRDTEVSFAADKAGAEAWARAAATAGVDLQKEQVGKQGTMGVWRVAREGLLRGLAGTSTGPVQGLIPAITASQQIADGAVAAVAPVLKQLFRSAGEGIFTDRDQQLLLDMVPKRGDYPETIASKMQMIDAIIEAKLAAPTSIPTPTRGGIPPQQPTNFASEAEAAAAAQAGQIKPGDRITVGGRSGVWQ